jgi:ribosomal protein S3AE
MDKSLVDKAVVFVTEDETVETADLAYKRRRCRHRQTRHIRRCTNIVTATAHFCPSVLFLFSSVTEPGVLHV